MRGNHLAYAPTQGTALNKPYWAVLTMHLSTVARNWTCFTCIALNKPYNLTCLTRIAVNMPYWAVLAVHLPTTALIQAYIYK